MEGGYHALLECGRSWVQALVRSNQKLYIWYLLLLGIKEKELKTGWLEIRIMCPSGTTCLLADSCFSELTL